MDSPKNQSDEEDLVEQYLKTPPKSTGGGKITARAAPSVPEEADLVEQYLKPSAAPAPAMSPSARMAGAVPSTFPGEEGLVRNGNGAFDPKTGELVIAGKPMAAQSPIVAGAGGIVSGVPILGPALMSGVQKGAAQLAASRAGMPVSQATSEAQDITNASNAAYPKTALAGNLIGGAVSTAPLVAAAPALMGASTELPWFANAALGGASGAAIGGADSAARGGNLADMLHGAEAGGVLGAGGSALASGLSAAGKGIINAFSGTTPAARNVSNILGDAGIAPRQAASNLIARGPQAVVADLDPSLEAEARGLAQTGGAPTSILRNAMTARAAGADDRISGIVSANLGPRPDITASEQAIKNAAQTRAGPFYDAARNSPTSMDVSPVAAAIDAQLPNASGGIKSVLNTIKSYLVNDTATAKNPLNATVLKDDSGGVLGARQAIDDLMYNKDTGEAKLGPNAMRIAGDLRGQLDQIVKGDSNIAAGDAAYAKEMARMDALHEGQDLLKPQTNIDDLKRSVASKSPAELSAMQNGALFAVHDLMENGSQGELSKARQLLSKSTANRAKVDALFPNSGNLFDGLSTQLSERATEQAVKTGSQTAANQAIQAKYGMPSGPGIGSVAVPFVGNAVAGPAGAIAGYGAQRAIDEIHNALTMGSLNRLKEGTARGLVASGAERGKFMNQVQRAADTNALSNNFSGAVMGAQPVAGAIARPLVPNYFSSGQNQ